MVKDKKKSGGTSPLNINNIPTTILEHEILSRLGTKDIVNLRRTNNRSIQSSLTNVPYISHTLATAQSRLKILLKWFLDNASMFYAYNVRVMVDVSGIDNVIDFLPTHPNIVLPTKPRIKTLFLEISSHDETFYIVRIGCIHDKTEVNPCWKNPANIGAGEGVDGVTTMFNTNYGVPRHSQPSKTKILAVITHTLDAFGKISARHQRPAVVCVYGNIDGDDHIIYRLVDDSIIYLLRELNAKTVCSVLPKPIQYNTIAQPRRIPQSLTSVQFVIDKPLPPSIFNDLILDGDDYWTALEEKRVHSEMDAAGIEEVDVDDDTVGVECGLYIAKNKSKWVCFLSKNQATGEHTKYVKLYDLDASDFNALLLKLCDMCSGKMSVMAPPQHYDMIHKCVDSIENRNIKIRMWRYDPNNYVATGRVQFIREDDIEM